MNTITQTIKLQRMTTTVLFSALALSFAAMCPAGDTTGANQSTVKYADLNVSSPQGAASLYARIRMAADKVCQPLYHTDLASKMRMDNCIRKAIADAVTKVNQPALFAVYNAKNNKKLQPTFLVAGQTR